MALNATFDTTLSRIRLTGTAIDPATEALFERSTNNIFWTTVRGGSAVAVNGSDEASVDDYEFKPNVVNYYRVTGGADIYTTTITPNQSGVFLKSIPRPFLNRSVTVTRYSDIVRPARNTIIEVIGRSDPIAVTDLRGSRRFDLEVRAQTISDADALEVMLSAGDPMFVQTDGENDIPGGYVVIGDFTRSHFGHVSVKRDFVLPMTIVAAPGPNVVGITSTWESLVAEYGTWADVLAAFGTWADVADYVADPDVVYVP